MKLFRTLFTVLMALAFAGAAFAAASSTQAASYNLHQPLHNGEAAMATISFESAAVNNTSTALGTIEMIKVPRNCVVTDVILATDDLDSGTTLTLDVGYGVNDDYFIAASTIGQAGGIARASAVTGLPLAFTAPDTIDVKVKALGTTAAGTIWLTVFYTKSP